MKLLKHYIVLCLLLLALPMAAQDWYFSIDEYREPEQATLQGVQRLLVVNNALVQPDDFGHSTVVDGQHQNGVSVKLDRALLYAMFSLTRTLDESGDFISAELLDISQNTSTNFYNRQTLSAQRVRGLLLEYEVDALLVLNQLIVYDVLESFIAEEGDQFAYIQAFAQSHWSVYYADANKMDYSFTYADTLVWESGLTYTRAQALNKLPSRQEALLYLASVLGEDLGRSMVHTWVSVPRYLYSDSHEAVQAGLNAFRYQRWEEAILYWQSVANTEGGKSSNSSNRSKRGKDKKAAAVAAANIATAYEMLGDYALACDYASEASRLFGALKTAWGRQQQVNIRYYLEQLRAKKAKEGAR
jgi:hypothetical protein